MARERASSKRPSAAADRSRMRRRAQDSAEDTAPFAGPEDPLSQLKSGAVPLAPSGMAALQRSVGNKAVYRLLAAPGKGVQRHWLEGEEKVQAFHDPRLAAVRARSPFANHSHLARRAANHQSTGRGLWRNTTGHVRRDDAKGSGVAVAPAPAEAKKGATGSISAITFAPGEIPADGKTTTKATVAVAGGAAVSKWGFVGNAFGSTIDASGVITPGNDLKKAESATVRVQASDEKGGATRTADLTLWDASLFQAKIDFPKFAGSTYTFPNFTRGLNGKFDVVYDPTAKTATANMKLKFVWPEEKVEAPSEKNLWGLVTAVKHAMYKANFVNQVLKQWSGRYEFRNVREPASIWGKLNPVAVKVNIQHVDADQHFTVEVRDRAIKAGEQTAVGGGVLTLYQGDDVPKPQFNPTTGAGELMRVNRVTPTPILFGLDSAIVPAADAAKLQTMGTYISRINNPKFDIQIVGHSSVGGSPAHNQKLSEQRAKAVADILNAAGATNHTIKDSGVGDSGVGDSGAAKTKDWRKVEITNATPAGFTNMQDTTAHEFGHMLGLGDEYAAAGVPRSTHYDLVAKAFGKDYAEQVAKRGDADHASIMDGGNDVRIQHYVTFWSALVETTLKAAQPDPKFGYDDWKFVGT